MNRAVEPGTQERRTGEIHLYFHLRAEDFDEVRKAVGRGASVACLTADPGLPEELEGAVTRLGAGALAPADLADWDELPLLRLTETVYDALAARSATPARAVRFAGSADVLNLFRRTLFLDLAEFFGLARLASSLDDEARIVVDRRWPAGPRYAALLTLWHSGAFAGKPGLELPDWSSRALDRLTFEVAARGPGEALKTFLRLSLDLVRTCLFVCRYLRLRAPTRSAPPRILARTYATDWGVNIGGIERLRNVDFFVGGSELAADDVAFWIEPGTPLESREALRQRGHRLLDADSLGIGPAGLGRLLRSLPALTALMLGQLREDVWWRAPVVVLAREYLFWSEVARCFHPRIFFHYNDLAASSPARNLALRQGGCRSVQYQHSCHWRPESSGWIRDYVLSFGTDDAVVTWGPAHSAFVKSHSSALGACWEVGCLWSEHARLVVDNPALTARFRQELADLIDEPPDAFERIVGVFDSSVGGILTAPDLIAFYEGIFRLARRLPHVLFVCKPKKNPNEADVDPTALLTAERERAPNVVVLPNLYETAAMIALSDLTINACFSSTLVETIGCGRRALYYDPTNCVPNAFWHRIPGLVCGDDEMLAERVGYLLEKCDTAEWAEYLADRLPQLEGRFDGRAITRLRNRLVAELPR